MGAVDGMGMVGAESRNSILCPSECRIPSFLFRNETQKNGLIIKPSLEFIFRHPEGLNLVVIGVIVPVRRVRSVVPGIVVVPAETIHCWGMKERIEN